MKFGIRRQAGVVVHLVTVESVTCMFRNPLNHLMGRRIFLIEILFEGELEAPRLLNNSAYGALGCAS